METLCDVYINGQESQYVGVFELPYFQTTVILNNLAKAYAESGKYKLAEEMAKEAVRIAESTQNSHLSRFLANLGTILNLEGIPLSSIKSSVFVTFSGVRTWSETNG